ncbi:MAG: PD-(D/E)XK nuclease family protein, partial [Ilumatobacteraceae bacterium]
MPLTATFVRPIDALASLADAVAASKGKGSALTPVTVVVPTNAAGVMARRWLGSHGGVAAVDMITLARLAELVAGPELARSGRRPVSAPLLDLAIRRVLTDDPGSFGRVALHPSTISALRDLHRELRVAGPSSLMALASASHRGREAARVSSLAAARLSGDWYDEGDLFATATRSIEQGDTAAAVPLDRMVCFLPGVWRGLEMAFVRAIADQGSVALLLAHTGHAPVDDELVELATAVGGTAATTTTSPDQGHLPAARERPAIVLSTTDADDEVRHAVRIVVDHARAGTPFGRMAVVWPTDRPYARLVEHHLDIAGLPWNGRPGTLVTERLVPRFLLDLLQVDRRGLRRRELFDLLADVPTRADDGSVVPVGRWERIARDAGVVRAEHWGPRLAQYSLAMRARAARDDGDGTSFLARADEADTLAAFVQRLQRDLGAVVDTRTWHDWAAWCERQIDWRLGERVIDHLDEAERLAFDHTHRVLDRLRHLDSVSPPVRRADFRAVFAAEFEVAPGRLGRIGTGVTIGSLSATVGLDVDLAIVIGAADGLLPPAPVVDPLITDSDRRLAGLATSEARVTRAHRAFLSLAQTTPHLVVGAPRGDLRATTERLPSRWIRAHLTDPIHHSVSSHHAGLLATAFPSAHGEHRLRQRLALAVAHPARLADTMADTMVDDIPAARGLRLRAARRSDHLTEYDGDLSTVELLTFDRPVSPSQIEAWPKCPHGYFMSYLLGVRAIDTASDDLSLSPIERGNVVHITLDRFHGEVLVGALPQPDTAGWSPAHAARLLQIFDQVADEFEHTGRTGRAAHWFLDRNAVRRELLTWFGLDGRTAAERGTQVVSSEFRFGHDLAVTLPLASGRRIAVQGSVDRIDRRTNGDLVVMDHKTGSDRNFTHITADDPTESGTRFQLPVYAAAALAARNGDDPLDSDVAVLA